MWKEKLEDTKIGSNTWKVERIVCSCCGDDAPLNKFRQVYKSRYCPKCGLDQYPENAKGVAYNG